MAVETKKSTFIGNRDASPTVPTGASILGGRAKEATGFVTVSASASIASFYPMVSVPSNARISSVKLQSGAQGTSCATNCGVYVPTQSNPALLALNSGYVGGAAINATFFASAQAIATATAITDITNQAGNNTIDKQEQELWQALGLASDPNCNLDIGCALSAAAVAGALLGLKVSYVQ